MTTYAQIYATTAEVIADLRLNGDEPGLIDRVKEASRLVQNKLGEFIPVNESRVFRPKLGGNLVIDPLLAASAVVNDTDTLLTTEYEGMPENRNWLNGPYTRLASDSVTWSANGVTITGQWGKCQDFEALDISSVSQALADTTLVVSNGAKISTGMVVLIESEQEVITGGNGDDNSPDPTIATSALNGAIGADDEEITVDNGSEFKKGEVLRLGTENCAIRRIVGNILVCARGWNGTTKALHANDLAIYVYRTFAVTRGVNGTSAALHTTKPVYRLKPPEDINWLTRQVAGLMRMKAAAGFASKTGNTELGETFYYSEFPSAFRQLYAIYVASLR